jgi:uncharacterized protein (DUF2252 family)
MASFNKFNAFVEHLAEKVHNLGSDTLKVYLSNTAPNAATHAVKGDLAEISSGNGYTSGGNAASISSSSQTSGTYKLVLADPATWTASSGSIGPFRYAVLYNDTAANDELIGWWDYGSALTLAAGETFTVDFDATTGVLTIA